MTSSVTVVRSMLHAVTLAALLVLPCAANAQGKIGFVNTERILRDAVPAKRAQKKIESEFQKRDQELGRMAEQLKRMQDEMERSAVTLSESQRRTKEREFGEMNREFQRKQREFREDFNQRRNEELQSIIERTNRIIRQMAEQEKYDLIVQEAVYFNPRIDITEKVLRALNNGAK